MSGSCRDALLEVRETLPDVPEWWEDLTDIREWSGGPPKCQGVVGRPSRISGSGREACWMAGSGWKALPNVQELSGEPPGWPGVRKTLTNIRKWSGVPPRYPGVVGRSFRIFRRGREAIPDVQEWTRDPPGCPKEVGGPSGCP